MHPTDEELVAALAAIQLFIQPDRPDEPPPETPVERWRVAARLQAQGIPASRAGALHWGSVERLRKVGQ